MASLTRIEIQSGSRWATGAMTGGILGGILTGLVGWVTNGVCDRPNNCGRPSTTSFMALGALGWGALGALIGSGSPRWAPAP